MLLKAWLDHVDMVLMLKPFFFLFFFIFFFGVSSVQSMRKSIRIEEMYTMENVIECYIGTDIRQYTIKIIQSICLLVISSESLAKMQTN
jgi:hypothetical protein